MRVVYRGAIIMLPILTLAITIGVMLVSTVAVHKQPPSATRKENSPEISIVVNVLQIDETNQQAVVEVGAHLTHIPTASHVNIWIAWGSYGGVMFDLSNDSWSRGIYMGLSDQTRWPMYGDGEAYPFDSYIMNFSVNGLSYVRQGYTAIEWPEDFSVSYDSFAVFTPYAGYVETKESLQSRWISSKSGVLPVEEVGDNYFAVRVARRSFIPSFQFLLPIVLSYFFLGSSMLLSRDLHLSSRMRIYLSLFVFAPTFMFAVRSMLPYRLSLSVPEVWLVNIIASTAILGIFSAIYQNSDTKGHLLDCSALTISMFLLIWTHVEFVQSYMDLTTTVVFLGSQTSAFLVPMILIVYRNLHIRMQNLKDALRKLKQCVLQQFVVLQQL